MAPQTWRLFIAHPVPRSIRERLEALLKPYHAAHPGVRWTRPETWHLTLLFLGAVHPEKVPELAALTDRVAQLGSPYRVQANAAGGRLRRGEGVAWLGLGHGAGAVIEVADRLADRCPSDITQGAPPKRTPAAHLTLVRRADANVIEALRLQAHGPLGVEWDIDDIVVVRSHLEPGGARYETLHRSTLYAAV